MDPIRAVTAVTHHIIERMRRRLDELFVALHAAHLEVEHELARAGERGVGDLALLIELPAIGLGRFLGATLVRWMIAPPVQRDAPTSAQLQELLLAPPSRAHDVLALPPLAWQARGHLALEAAHRVLDALASAASTSADGAQAAKILETFCAHADASFAALDGAAVEARCTEALWTRWLAAWVAVPASLADLERQCASQSRLLGAIERRHPHVVAQIHDARARTLAADAARV